MTRVCIDILDKGYIELLDIMPRENADLAVINAARVSYLEESKGDTLADKKLLRYLYEHRHTTPFEQVQFKFRIKCPIFVARQWMRHRTWSYNEQSRRYSDAEPQFYYPEEWRRQDFIDKQGSITGAFTDEVLAKTSTRIYGRNKYLTLSEMLEGHCLTAVRFYNAYLAAGISREMARMFLPVNMYTTFVGSVNAHNLMRFLRLRMDKHAQYEIRVYAEAIFDDIFSVVMPWTAKLFKESLK